MTKEGIQEWVDTMMGHGISAFFPLVCVGCENVIAFRPYAVIHHSPRELLFRRC